ncbi:MAG: protein-ADP-ribose hydrolase [Lachnospiraceae bacterium]|nr:protein-ADP-ribose hydrolase [Lachnospiraceae bacterium]
MADLKKIMELNELLLEDQPEYYGEAGRVPKDVENQRYLMRSLMNVRFPKVIPKRMKELQDEVLSEIREEKGIVDVNGLESVDNDKRIVLWQGDITRLNSDAIVNAANSQMLGCFIPGHNCIDNVIHTAAGMELREECNEIMQKQGDAEPTGQAKITGAYNLPCKHVIHTVGPIVNGKLKARHEEALASCYRSCLNLAEEYKLKSIAFCCISTGVFMFPNIRAAEIAVETVRNWLDETGSEMKIIFNVFKDIDLDIYNKLLNSQS